MAADGPEVEDARSRLLVQLERAPSPGLEAALGVLQAADRLGALVVARDLAGQLAGVALALPTALLTRGGEPRTGTAGVCIELGDDPRRAVQAARARWGADAILLADAGLSRHAAMEAGECGADAVLFRGEPTAVADCVTWWSQLFVLPAAAEATPDALDALVAAGADFLLIEEARLTGDDGAAVRLVERLRAAERRRDEGRRAARETVGDEDQR